MKRYLRRAALQSAPWIKVVRSDKSTKVLQFIKVLDSGEAEAVRALAAEHDARLILLDEKKGRRNSRKKLD